MKEQSKESVILELNPEMRSVVVLLLSITLCFSAFSQSGTIVGKVIDSQTAEPVEFVTVYVNRTTIGTTTASDGTFSLSAPAGNVELVASRVGYKTHTLIVPVGPGQRKEVILKLTIEDRALGEVVISARSEKDWEKNFALFRKVFLGTDEIADKCVILNKEVLSFEPLKEGRGFTASATAPLEIINPMLGYKIKYALVNFKYANRAYAIAGNIQFENLLAETEAVSREWDENRQTAYRNSVRSFLKSVIANRVKENGYEAFAEKTRAELGRASMFAYVRPTLIPFNRALHLRDTTNGDFVFYSPTRLEIHDTRVKRGSEYRDVRYAVSWIELTQPLHISREGVIYNQGAIQQVGYLSTFRIAHLLPENYQPDHVNETVALPPRVPTEQLYVHTDRNYYFPGDVIWLKGYMEYSGVQNPDSMSRVAYVELIDERKNVITRKSFPIEYATFDGSVTVPASIDKTNLTLRIYTQWMQNFDSPLFMKPVPILDSYERVIQSTATEERSDDYSIVTKPSKNSYRLNDDIELQLYVISPEGDSIAADLSIAVTNVDEFKPITDPTPIAQAFLQSPKQISTTFAMEKGISVEGKLTNNGKKISEPTTITAVIGELQDVATVKSTRDGNFFITGFHFYDSAMLALQALTRKKRPFGQFTIRPRSYPPVDKLPDAVIPAVKRVNSAVAKSHLSDGDGGILLKEVTVTAKKEKPYKDVYTSGEISITGDRLLELNVTDVMSIFKGRIPRVRVVYQMNEMGILQEFLWIPGVGIPLVVIDGVAFEGEYAMRTIKTLNVRDIERIDVMTNSSAALYGSRGGNGVVIIMTRTQNHTFDSGNPTKFSTRDFSTFSINGFSSFKQFEQVVPESENTPTLYWSPYVLVDSAKGATVKLKATVASRYLISIKGFTTLGHPLSATTVINVTH